MEDKKELIRAATRPMLLFVMVLTSALFLGCDIQGALVDYWCYTTMAMVSEWIVERPILKIAGKA